MPRTASAPPPPLHPPPSPPQSPKHTKSEIREYLEKVYNVKVARVTTSITMGAWRSALSLLQRQAAASQRAPTPPPPLFAGKRKRVPGRRLIMRTKDYKRALVQLHDNATLVPPPKAQEKEPELR